MTNHDSLSIKRLSKAIFSQYVNSMFSSYAFRVVKYSSLVEINRWLCEALFTNNRQNGQLERY
jgi:hypothetical protein